jgi:thiosulfate reductase cytochrome b subunit
MKRVYMYTVEERLWHWFQALLMMALMGTGLVIHYPTAQALLAFETASRLHEWLGLLLAVNAVIGLLYHLFSRVFRQYLPEGRTWMGMAVDQVKYYTWGIFRGAPHPMQKTVEHKLNPLQQVTYLGILNVLLPLQLLTGMAILVGRLRPDLLQRAGDLGLIAPLHMLGAWLFMAFLVGHIYLTTTGHTLMSNIVAMIIGWEDLEEEGEPHGKHTGK